LHALRRRTHLQPVFDVANATAAVGQVLGAVLHPALRHGAFKGRGAVGDLDLDAAGVHVVVAGQAFAQVFGDALVRAGVVARPDATVTTAVGAAAELGAAVALAPHAGVALLGVAGRHEGFAAVALAAVAVLVRVAIARACPVALALLPVLIAGIALLGVRAAVALVLLLASLLRVLARRAVLVLRTALPVRLGTRAVPAGFAVVRSLAQRGLAQALL